MMAKKNLQGKSGTYHLAEALTSYNLASGAGLEKRADILGIIAEQVYSMLQGLDLAADALNEIEANMLTLESADLGLMDQDLTMPIRKDMKRLIRKTYGLLFGLIRRHNLITISTLMNRPGGWDAEDEDE